MRKNQTESAHCPDNLSAKVSSILVEVGPLLTLRERPTHLVYQPDNLRHFFIVEGLGLVAHRVVIRVETRVHEECWNTLCQKRPMVTSAHQI